jgi:hypothetical protein
MDAVEVALEGIDVSGPEAAERGQPGFDFVERFGFKTVEAALRGDGGFHETGVAQDAQVLGNGGLGHAELALDLSDGLLGGEQEAENGAAIGLGDDLEGRFHGYCILHGAYTCQGILGAMVGAERKSRSLTRGRRAIRDDKDGGSADDTAGASAGFGAKARDLG